MPVLLLLLSPLVYKMSVPASALLTDRLAEGDLLAHERLPDG
jgi:hypothetical protein